MIFFFAMQPHLKCSFKPTWDYKNVWKLWNCFINGMSKNAKHRRVMCYYTLVCTRRQYTASSLHLALRRIKLSIKFTSSTSLLEKVASVSCRQLKSIRSRTRTTITLSTVLFLLYNFWECFHWGAHGKKNRSSQNMSCIVILLLKNVHWQTLGWNLVRIALGFLQLEGFVCQLNFPLAINVMSEQPKQKILCTTFCVITTKSSNNFR